MRAGACNLGSIYTLLLRKPAGTGRNRRSGDNLTGRRNIRHWLFLFFFGNLSRLLGSGGWRSRRSEFIKSLSRISNDHDVGKDGNLVILIIENGKYGTLDLGFFVKRGLVGLIAEEHVTDGHSVADLLFKFGNDATFNALPLFGHNYNLRHRILVFILFFFNLQS